jgi:hypothetical protein
MVVSMVGTSSELSIRARSKAFSIKLLNIMIEDDIAFDISFLLPHHHLEILFSHYRTVRVKPHCPLALLLAFSSDSTGSFTFAHSKKLPGYFFDGHPAHPLSLRHERYIKKIRIENISLKYGSITTSTSAFLHCGAVMTPLFHRSTIRGKQITIFFHV